MLGIATMHTEANVCGCTEGLHDYCKSALKVDRQKNPLPHEGVENVSAMRQTQPSTTQTTAPPPQVKAWAVPTWHAGWTVRSLPLTSWLDPSYMTHSQRNTNFTGMMELFQSTMGLSTGNTNALAAKSFMFWAALWDNVLVPCTNSPIFTVLPLIHHRVILVYPLGSLFNTQQAEGRACW